jgi:ABC-type sugar transport system substrate-binding protein
MVDSSNVRVTIGFVDADWDEEERETAAQNLLRSLQDLDAVESVGRVPEIAPDGSKAALGFLTGLLMAEVNKDNAKKLFGFLGNRLTGKTIELEVEGNGKKLKVKAGNEAELKMAIAEAEKFIQG